MLSTNGKDRQYKKRYTNTYHQALRIVIHVGRWRVYRMRAEILSHEFLKEFLKEDAVWSPQLV